MNLTNLLLKVTLVAIGLLFATSSKADIEMRPSRVGGSDLLTLSGEIKKSDIIELQKLLPKHNVIWLNSSGGDVSAAMDIGRLLRQSHIVALIDYNQVCASACVFVLAGSPSRIVEGKVGIHRPYLPHDDATTVKEQKASYDSLREIIVNYLEFMNINPTLYDDMFRISSSNIKFLSTEELVLYGLSGRDPYVEEAANAIEAKELQISKQELLKRKKEEENCMRFFNISNKDLAICMVATKYGISMDEYIKRDEIAKSECGDREADKLKWRNCQEKILRGSN